MQQVIEERLENESCTADDRALRKSQSYGHSRSNMAPFNKEYADYMKVEILNNDEVLVNADGTINHSSDINPANVAAGTDAHKNIEKEPSIAWIRFIKMVVSLGVMEYCPPPEQVEAM